QAVATLQRAAHGLGGGLCAFVFPEGTRSRDGSLQPFKKGGFKLAMQAGVPVVPVTIVGTRRLLLRDSIVFRRGPVRMDVGEPIPTAALRDEDLPELMELVRRSMQARLEVGI
ncbi:MAG TPA: lysophospholipid acyltransferase family protein, partial [Pyrinomonadaceae bacterium]|nr:lysophospholipid acyltransferase family protein [Pyrinomonadaceae bacterium]